MRTGADRMENREEILKIENLKKSFGKTEVLKGIDMTVYKNEIISVLGPSGCGKSTLLNIIAGMLMPDGGSAVSYTHLLKSSRSIISRAQLTGPFWAFRN